MRIRDLLILWRDVPRTDLLVLAGHALGLTMEELLRDMNEDLPEDRALMIGNLAARRKAGTPLAYLTNTREFFSETYYVDERVLIPRPETEILVEEALRILEKRDKPSYIMDVGTGSGIIALTLARLTRAKALAVDISPEALLVARENGRRLSLLDRVSFVCADLLSAVCGSGHFDIIAANLPYVADEDWGGLMADVREHEPRRALRGGQGGLEVYRRLLFQAPGFLKREGALLCEIDGPVQAAEMTGMLHAAGLCAVVIKDLSGRERIIEGSWIDLS